MKSSNYAYNLMQNAAWFSITLTTFLVFGDSLKHFNQNTNWNEI